jgi:hypothetical protein
MKALAPWFAAALLAVGLPWWLAPYNRFSLSHPVAILGCLAFLLIAAGAGGWSALRPGRAVLAVGTAVPVAVVLRVVVGGFRDPTSHNLWPFEVLIMAVPGFALATLGVLAGRRLRRILGPA